MVSISAQPPSCGEQRAQIAQGAPRHQEKMVRQILEAFITVANSLTRSLLRDQCVLADGCVTRMCPRGPRRQLGGTRYRTMSRWSEMVTSVTMSGTIMAQRSDFSDQRSFRVTASEIYKWRHLIENFFCKLKEFKRIAMRADKTDQSFAANILLAAAVINSR
jgi:transposase